MTSALITPRVAGIDRNNWPESGRNEWPESSEYTPNGASLDFYIQSVEGYIDNIL